MSLVNYSTREITCKVVYYGPGRSGKTTNLQFIHAHVPDERKGGMVSLATETDRTLFFDYLPLELGRISGFRIRMQLYTVPGQVYYDATRKLVLQGTDGVVFVADSQPERQDENVESFRNLHDNLLEQGVDPRRLPICLQLNKRDLPNAVPRAGMEEVLNYRGLPCFEASALVGVGVFETLRGISERVLERMSARLHRPGTPVGSP
jgi:signal recognition particle receptor subunit beta